MLKLKLQYFGYEPTHWKIPWCSARLKEGGEGDDRRWDVWTASLTQWIWVWANSRRWWGTGRPGMLQSMGSQRVRHDWAAAQQQVYGSPTWQVWDLILLWLCPSYHLTVGSSLSLDMGDLFFLVGSSILLSMVVQQLAVILVLLQEEVSACPSTLPSWTESPTIIYLYMYALLLFFPSTFQLPAVRSCPLA